jgi:hypothetical protein
MWIYVNEGMEIEQYDPRRRRLAIYAVTRISPGEDRL